MSLGWLSEAGRVAEDLSVGPVSIVLTVRGDGIDVMGTITTRDDRFRNAKPENFSRILRVRYQDLDTAATNLLADAVRQIELALRGTRR